MSAVNHATTHRAHVGSLAVLAKKALRSNARYYAASKRIYHLMVFLMEGAYIKVKYPYCKMLLPLPGFLAKIGDEGFKSQYGQEKYALDLGLIPVSEGFFVEVGSNDPEYLSNSWALEKKLGYHGISLDGIDVTERFAEKRPGTKFINALVSRDRGHSTFYEVQGSEPWHSMLSGAAVDVDLSERNLDVRARQVQTIPLADVLREAACPVDILFVDVEGHELSVLESIDWSGCRPKVIVVENFGNMARQERLRAYLSGHGYRLEARVWISDDIFVSLVP